MSQRVNVRQIQDAREVNFLNFMQDEYPSMIEYSSKWKAYIHPQHDSLKYFEHGYFRFSTNEGGDGIKFLQEWCGMSFQDAVLALWRYSGDHKAKATYARANKSYKPPVVTSQGCERAFAYLTFTRKISPHIVFELMNKHLIYEDKRGNVVFINREPGEGIAIVRGTAPYEDTPPFKRIYIEKSNNYWEFAHGENPKKVYVCESPIDAISLYEITNEEDAIYTAMAGLKPETLRRIIDDYPDKQIFTAVDWDSKGKAFAVAQYKEHQIRVVAPPAAAREQTKDWNEYLVFLKCQKNG